MKNLSSSDLQQIIALCKQGIPQREIISLFGIGLSRLRKIAVEAGLNGGWRDHFPLNENVFSEISNPEAAYWVGFLMADGNVCKSRVSLKLARYDENHLVNFQQFVGAKNHVISRRTDENRLPQGTRGSYDSSSLQFNCTKMVSDLSLYGVSARKSHSAVFSDAAAANKLCWLGLIDGDGSVGYARKCPRLFLSGSRLILEQFNDVFLSGLGLSPATISVDPRRVPQINIYSKRCLEIVDHLWVGHTLGLSRKRSIAEGMRKGYRFSRHQAKTPGEAEG